MEQYLTVAGAGPMQWECWGGEAGSDTAGETPCVGALTVTHPGGETRPGEHWLVRTPQIFHTRLLRCTHTHTQGWMHTLSCPSHYCLVPLFFLFLCRELKYFTSSKSILVHWSVCMPCSKPWETIHHANQAVSQVKMNWLWVRAMRGRAYGSDEAENWPQKKNESEGERKGNHKGGQKKVKRKKEREKGRKGVWELGIKAASKNAGRGWALLQLNSEWYINTGLVLGCPS